jgi:hypothetical protein
MTARRYDIVVCMLLLTAIVPMMAQHIENDVNGVVRNSGVLRFHNDTGQYRNAAPYSSLTNGTIEFLGVTNGFADLTGNPRGATAFGGTRAWRVPGTVRYARNGAQDQFLQARYYSDLTLDSASAKRIPDSVLVGNTYELINSGPRRYVGTFFYDGSLPQRITQENGLTSIGNRYNNLSLLFSTKRVADVDEVRLDSVFTNDAASSVDVNGSLYWGTRARTAAVLRIDSNGLLMSGSGVSLIGADIDVRNGLLVLNDRSDSMIIEQPATLRVQASPTAQLTAGEQSQLIVRGDFVNAYGPLTNMRFHPSSLIAFDALQPQQMQATSASSAYGNLKTTASRKTARGDIWVERTITVHDSDVVMLPYTLSMKLGVASYRNDAEVIGALRRQLVGSDTSTTYVYNNAFTSMKFERAPSALTMDVRPLTSPNAYNPLTDVQRKITVSYQGQLLATVSAAYKASDIPSTWGPNASERLMKLYNAYGQPLPRAFKLAPSAPPTYVRRPAGAGSLFGFVQVSGVVDVGPDNQRLDSGNDLLLRATRDTMRAIASGRWSNPFTWDEAREPEPIDRVIIDGFTVHAGFVRDNDRYAVNEAYPDSLVRSILIGQRASTSLLIGSTGTFSSFSLVPEASSYITVQRSGAQRVSLQTQDVSAANLDVGLLIYRGATFSTSLLTVDPLSTVFNGGYLVVGMP